jgi:Flp pilus assembly protein TadG
MNIFRLNNPSSGPLFRRFRRDNKGVVAVEFALIIPVFLVMVFGTLEIGNMLYAKSTLQHGVETAGRYAMVHISATVAEIEQEALAKTDHLNTLNPTFTVGQSTVDGVPFADISASAIYTLMTPFFTGATINLSSSISVPQTKPEDFS